MLKIPLDWLARLGSIVTTNVNKFGPKWYVILKIFLWPPFSSKTILPLFQVPWQWDTGMRNESGVTFSMEIQRTDSFSNFVHISSILCLSWIQVLTFGQFSTILCQTEQLVQVVTLANLNINSLSNLSSLSSTSGPHINGQ